jgi:hypothetical protein
MKITLNVQLAATHLLNTVQVIPVSNDISRSSGLHLIHYQCKLLEESSIIWLIADDGSVFFGAVVTSYAYLPLTVAAKVGLTNVTI